MRFRVKNPSGTSKTRSRQRTRRKAPVSTQELIDQINPVIRGWGQYYCKAHVRKLFHQLDGLDRAASLVASSQAMAQRWLETAAGAQAHWRVRTCTPDLSDSFLEPSMRQLCESGLRENCTSRLSGGRRPAPTGASSDPTAAPGSERLGAREPQSPSNMASISAAPRRSKSSGIVTCPSMNPSRGIVPAAGASHGDQLDQRLAIDSNRDRLAGSGLRHQPRQMRLGFVDVDDAHAT